MHRIPIVYKYRPIDEYTEKLLIKNELFFPRHKDLNDPFECQTEYIGRANCLRRFLYFMKYSNEQNNDKRLISKLKFASTALKPHFSKEKESHAIKKVNEYYRNKIDNAGIVAFTDIRDSILMWSHYADNHKGICLQFDFSKAPLFRKDPFWNVVYRKKYPAINFYSFNANKNFRKGCMTKSHVWKYENEKRIVWENGGISQQFYPSALIGVIFGCSVEGQNKKRILKLLRDRNLPITIYEAKMNIQEFKLDISKIDKIE